MGIKNAVLRVADKAGNAVAKVSSLSSAQLDEIERKRESYLSEKPDPSDPQAVELTNRLLATAGVEIHGAYLSQLRDVYCPVDPTVEYPDGFDEAHNIRFMNVTKWIVDPKEDSLEKLVNVYDVLADEDCNIALVFNRTSSTTNVYLAVVDVNNTEDNIDVDNFTKRIADAIKGNFPGSEIGAAQRGTIPDSRSKPSKKYSTALCQAIEARITPSCCSPPPYTMWRNASSGSQNCIRC